MLSSCLFIDITVEEIRKYINKITFLFKRNPYFLFLRFALQLFTSTKFFGSKKRNFSLVIEPPINYLDKTRNVPSHITRPHYAHYNKEIESTGFLASLLQTGRGNKNGTIKSSEMVSKIKKACWIGRRVLNTVHFAVKVFQFVSMKQIS